MHIGVNCRVCELAIELLVVEIFKRPINHITNPNPVYSYPIARQYSFLIMIIRHHDSNSVH
jgi:hypothetical protein